MATWVQLDPPSVENQIMSFGLPDTASFEAAIRLPGAVGLIAIVSSCWLLANWLILTIDPTESETGPRNSADTLRSRRVSRGSKTSLLRSGGSLRRPRSLRKSLVRSVNAFIAVPSRYVRTTHRRQRDALPRKARPL